MAASDHLSPEQFWEHNANHHAELPRRNRAAHNLAEQNADDTSVERGFGLFTEPWYETYQHSHDHMMDTMTPDMEEDWGH